MAKEVIFETVHECINNEGRITGKILLDIVIDKKGNVISANVISRGTTITDTTLIKKCEDAVKSSKYNALDSAPEEQHGRLSFVFNVN